ncbi:hypothetical protein J1N35_044103 [Gossypium stocksii]|uniref:Endonuclease/exonuclease/phosphatase domain-containing protein n=1 Tax=Gossypium stocksii TaxID=47602 RepID=A0A9D3U8L5_9ROSI|nr:hypothetical protein J1N35_044103 [Gossypium stocksii]
MKILSWNVRGLGRSRTVNRLRNKLRAINLHILFLMETKLDSKKMELVRVKCGFPNGIDVSACSSKGGLSLEWKGIVDFASWIGGQSKAREQKHQRASWERKLSSLYNQDPTDKVLTEIMEAQIGLNIEADKEEIFWEQRARVNWLKNGDRNTNFFHKVVISRNKRNRILGLSKDDSELISNPDDMLRVVIEYFGKLFTASDVVGDYRVLSLVEQKVSSSMNDDLLKPFSKEDIRIVIKEITHLKAP